MRPPQTIIKRPLLTEKGTRLKESGGRPEKELDDETEVRAKLFFEVDRSANKIEIRHAIEELFKVKVHDVRTQVCRGKDKRVGRFAGRRPNWKKAIVTLAEGHSIDFFEGQQG